MMIPFHFGLSDAFVCRHDYLGRSAARDSLLLWTHHLKNITYDSALVPQGAPSTESYPGENN